jgi:hypothetical protein
VIMEIVHANPEGDREFKVIKASGLSIKASKYVGLIYKQSVEDMPENNILTATQMKKHFPDQNNEREAQGEAEAFVGEGKEPAAEDGLQHADERQVVPQKDRANQEVFISQNGDRNLKYFDSEKAASAFRESHLDALQKTKDAVSKTMVRLEDRPKRQLFW